MGSSLLIIFILAIYHSILFYGKNLGLNVILFVVPVLIFLTVVLKKNNLIKNKKGLLFLIPITALSATYFIYDNSLFEGLNILVIPALIILMYIFTINPTNRFSHMFADFINLVFAPLGCIGKVFNLVKIKLNKTFKLSKSNKKRIVSVLIVLPITIIVLYMLAKGDMMFAKLINKALLIFKNISFSNLIGRLFIILVLFTFFGAVINYLLFNYKHKTNTVAEKRKFEPFTMELLLTVLNIIYLVFAIIQVVSLVFHKVASSIDYAKYARSGFFWLMIISLINLAILLYTKRVKNEKSNIYNKIMSVIMTLLTLVIIASAFVRMYRYCDYYGFTTLRILVYGVLITEVILLIPTLVYIFNSKSNVFKNYLAIIVVSYVVMNLIPMNNIIAKENLSRYYNDSNKNSFDIFYLQNYSADNIPELTKFYDDFNSNIKNESEVTDLNWYLYNVDYKTNGFQEYNISKQKANKALEEFKKTHKEIDLAKYYESLAIEAEALEE